MTTKKRIRLWPQSIHEQVKSPESGSEGKAAVLGQRQNYCRPDTPHPQGNGFHPWSGHHSHLESFTKHRFQGHPRLTMYFRGGTWEYVVSKSAIGDWDGKPRLNAMLHGSTMFWTSGKLLGLHTRRQDSCLFSLSDICNQSVPASLALQAEVINQEATAFNFPGLSSGSPNIGDAFLLTTELNKRCTSYWIRCRFSSIFGAPVLWQALHT